MRTNDRRALGYTEREDSFTIGFVGEPVIWTRSDVNLLPILQELDQLWVVTSVADGKDYYYKVKEYKNGWWKLEWPD